MSAPAILLNDFVYDLETYPNVFTFGVHSMRSMKRRTYEISPRRFDMGPIMSFVQRCQARASRWIGFNNLHYDYPMMHYLLTELADERDWETVCWKLFKKSESIINAPHTKRFAHVIWDSQQLVPQIDLMKIHHFDNQAKMTSLKMLEFNMRMVDIRELPFAPGTVLNHQQIGELVDYNDHDLEATARFLGHSMSAISFREALSAKYDRNFLNHNDTKIGKDYFIMQLERKLGARACYTREDGKRKPRQTKREKIALCDVILPYVDFETSAFRAVLAWLRKREITETKGVFSDLSLWQMLDFLEHSLLAKKPTVRKWMSEVAGLAKTSGELPPEPKTRKADRRLSVLLDGVEFVFGTGGIHASVHDRRVESTDDLVIVDLDVTSYYPSLAIANKFFPKHLSEEFCTIYADVKRQRLMFMKGTPENKVMKLALNGVFGDSNNSFSPFFDPQFTMSITVNGQLLLCMLYESLRKIPSLELIQVNTDGVTVRLSRAALDQLHECKMDWELMTGLQLEEAHYEFMHIRDVNNYIAKYLDSDKVKRKGAYEYEREWHQNHSSLVIRKAAEAAIVHGTPIREFIENHEDAWDFLLRTKVPRSSKLIADYGLGLTRQIQNISRFYIAKDGAELVKVMPPLPKAPDKWREISINSGCKVQVCNHFEGELDRNIIDFDWYVTEAEKLVNFEVDDD